MKPQLVIFDWAGTTVDYGCFAPVNAFALAFQKFGIHFLRRKGNRKKNFLIRFLWTRL